MLKIQVSGGAEMEVMEVVEFLLAYQLEMELAGFSEREIGEKVMRRVVMTPVRKQGLVRELSKVRRDDWKSVSEALLEALCGEEARKKIRKEFDKLEQGGLRVREIETLLRGKACSL